MRELSPEAKNQAILFTLGTFDPIIPVEKVKGQLNQLRQDGGLQIESREFAKDHTIAGEEELSFIRDFLSAQRQAL